MFVNVIFVALTQRFNLYFIVLHWIMTFELTLIHSLQTDRVSFKWCACFIKNWTFSVKVTFRLFNQIQKSMNIFCIQIFIESPNFFRWFTNFMRTKKLYNVFAILLELKKMHPCCILPCRFYMDNLKVENVMPNSIIKTPHILKLLMKKSFW